MGGGGLSHRSCLDGAMIFIKIFNDFSIFVLEKHNTVSKETALEFLRYPEVPDVTMSMARGGRRNMS